LYLSLKEAASNDHCNDDRRPMHRALSFPLNRFSR
jgi:hypothetical protein